MRAAVIFCACLALAAGGCGGDDDEQADSPDASPATTAQTVPEGAGRGERPPEGPAGPGGERGEVRGPSDDDAGPPPRAEYVRSADGICLGARVEVAAARGDLSAVVADRASGKIDDREYLRRSGEVTAKLARIADRTVDRLEALPRPASGPQAALDDYLEAARSQVQLLEELAEAQRSGDREAVSALTERMAKTADRSGAAAERFGLRNCGTPFG